MNEIQHAEIVILRELHEESVIRVNGVFQKEYIRVTGEVTFVDTEKRYCQLKHGIHDLMIDLSVIDFKVDGFQIGCLCQFLGDLNVIDKVK